ncbi:hypothetical protein L1987_15449 [Smallanthus sonchifolius]|uniref:Uncharacterized protein n=1 Tax=Smallanthus sonchifolius TaxID=185202 RepID=A0ACB9J5M7_9ASTR|nr:hypothetical protein L1987_15449 [Smallanthus sonchifolius]
MMYIVDFNRIKHVSAVLPSPLAGFLSHVPATANHLLLHKATACFTLSDSHEQPWHLRPLYRRNHPLHASLQDSYQLPIFIPMDQACPMFSTSSSPRRQREPTTRASCNRPLPDFPFNIRPFFYLVWFIVKSVQPVAAPVPTTLTGWMSNPPAVSHPTLSGSAIGLAVPLF